MTDFEANSPRAPVASWRDVRAAYNAMTASLRGEGGDPVSCWEAFRASCLSRKPPNHLFQVEDRISENKEAFILDHGCGAGINVCFFIARGFRNAFGVDLPNREPAFAPVNAFLVGQGIVSHEPLRAYEGVDTGLESGRFDLIYSNQVVEHLSDRDFQAYFHEERRLLKADGRVVHEFPHRHMIFEGHLRTYMVHMLPKPVLVAILRATGSDRHLIIDDGFYLRSVREIRSMVEAEFPRSRDITRERLMAGLDLMDYEGNRTIRRIFQVATRLPGLSAILPGLAIRTVEAWGNSNRQ